MELGYPLAHQFLDRVVYCVTLLVEHYLADNFAITLPGSCLAYGLRPNGVRDVTLPSVLRSHFVQEYLFVLALFLRVLEILTDRLVYWTWVYYDYKVVRYCLHWHILTMRL